MTDLREIKTLREVARENKIPVTTLKARLELKSYEMLEGIDYKKLGHKNPILLSPSGVRKILESHRK